MTLFFWFILIIIIGWILLLVVIPLLGRLFLKRFQSTIKQQQSRQKEEGSVTIENPDIASSKSNDIGDYVEYEEIKENDQ
jgi:predicted membrane protein